MKKSRVRVLTLMIAFVMLLGQFSFAEGLDVVTISGEGIESPLSLSKEDLLAVPAEGQIEDEYIYNSRTGEKSVMVKGVSLKYVLVEMLGLGLTDGEVHFTAADGYPIDPQALEDVLSDDLKYVMAYEIDGESIDNDEDATTDEIVVYRKVKTEGEFGTVFKLVVDIEIKANKDIVKLSGDGIEGSLGLSMEDLMAVPAEGQIEEEYIYNSKTGEKSAMVKGVSLKYVLVKMLGLELTKGEVHFAAADGYPIDPQALEDVLSDDLKYVMAYEINGTAIDNDEDATTDEIVVYRKVKTEGEFGTVFKLVVDVEVKAEEPVIEEPVVPAVFTDITEEFNYAATAISVMAEKGIINGVGGGLFAPGREFTRAEFAKIMVLSLGYELADYDGSFSDVDNNDWFAPYVQAAVESGLFKGYTDGRFKPNQTINRQEMATVAGRGAIALGLVDEARVKIFVMEKSDFLDKENVADWAANYVAWLEAQGAFTEIAGEEFLPTQVVIRAEAAVMVYNTLFAQ